MKSSLRFICPKCQKTTVELVMGGATVTTPILEINDDGIDYDLVEQNVEDGHIEHYQCHGCGYVLKKDGHTIANEDDFLLWLAEQPYNKKGARP